MDIYDFLQQHGIPYDRHDHPAVFTCEESAKLPKYPGADTKNLFVCDDKKRQYYLVSVPHEKRVDLKMLAKTLGERRLSFGSPEKLKEYLGVTPGSVTIMGLMFDATHAVRFIVDESIWKADAVQCHPLINTGTLVIPHAGLEKFLAATGHEAKAIDVPALPA